MFKFSQNPAVWLLPGSVYTVTTTITMITLILERKREADDDETRSVVMRNTFLFQRDPATITKSKLNLLKLY